MSEIPAWEKSTKAQLAEGRTPAEVAEFNTLPLAYIWSLQLEKFNGILKPEGTSKADQEKWRTLHDLDKAEQLDFAIRPYDVWNFSECSDLFGEPGYPGRIPGQLVLHVLFFYTSQGDVVIDPMAGSGTTADACLIYGRHAYCYDVQNKSDRPDILEHDLHTAGWPDRTKDANLIFWDPPYYSKMDDENVANGYGEKSISKLDRKSYLQFFRGAFKELHGLVKKNTVLAFLMSDWNDNKGKDEGVFLWHYADGLRKAGWHIERHIAAPLSPHQMRGNMVTNFRETRQLGRIHRWLLIARKVE